MTMVAGQRSLRRLLWPSFFTCIAFVLFAAACSKAYSELYLPRSQRSLPSSVVWLMIAVEVVSAWWLISGWKRRACVAALFAMFVCFSGYSAWQVASGATSCGCFGAKLSVPPKVVLAFDVVVASVFGVASWRAWKSPATARFLARDRWDWISVRVATAMMLIAASYFVVTGIPSAKGIVVVGGNFADLGTLRGADASGKSHIFVLKNEGNVPIQITGMHSSCRCTTADVRKATLAPSEKIEVQATVNWSDRAGPHQEEIVLDTDIGGKGSVRLTVSGTVEHVISLGEAEVDFGTLDASKEAVRRLPIFASGSTGISDVRVSSSNPIFALALTSQGADEKVNQFGARQIGTLEISCLRAVPDQSAQAREHVAGSIHLTVKDTDRLFTTSLRARRVACPSIFPSQIPRDPGAPQSIEVRSHSSKRFQVEDNTGAFEVVAYSTSKSAIEGQWVHSIFLSLRNEAVVPAALTLSNDVEKLSVRVSP